MHDVSYPNGQSNIIRFNRIVFGEEEFQELKKFVEQAGARIIETAPLDHGDRFEVLLEMDTTKKQF